MTPETVPLPGSAGTRHELLVRRYGTPGARPKVHIQAGLHADEMPGVLTAHHLCALLAQADVVGEVIVLPLANPLGLGQWVLGGVIGRFSLADGMNYNRGYPRLWEPAGDALVGRLGQDEAANGELARAAASGTCTSTGRRRCTSIRTRQPPAPPCPWPSCWARTPCWWRTKAGTIRSTRRAAGPGRRCGPASPGIPCRRAAWR